MMKDDGGKWRIFEDDGVAKEEKEREEEKGKERGGGGVSRTQAFSHQDVVVPNFLCV